MNQYITGSLIKRLREEKGMTQAALASKLSVSDKAISRWETGKGYPDITMIELIADALGISVAELFSGSDTVNRNRSANLLRGKLYVCPVCGNIISSVGEATISCCGVSLIPLEAEEPDSAHMIKCEPVEDEFYITVNHDMTKEHYISFIAGVSDNGVQVVKLYPEGNADARIKRRRISYIYYYCNKDGLFKVRVSKM